ncbi:hypothetical protein Arub01_54740 [Actinomadura rubrobrunea]|uniref:Uncharacterized protein n=2 Tax=Actinomadura rubrobrunea TaxID=115335 RepID=A0A9W6UX15_9ACTN|nr:hypothetical protein [Actinomadura rubrobrunea]GLW67231.1 hypothetical protein Arub01_54740 [Actinomadura rubrobrunea]
MITLADVPPLRGPRPPGAERVRRRGRGGRLPRIGRRGLLAGLAAAGATAGLNLLGVFPPARQALAAGFRLTGNYDVYPRCPSYARDHNCSPGCGPSLVCSDCCRTSGKHKGFHKSGASHPGKYKLRPNQCRSGGYDAWLWAYAGKCGKCTRGVTWRCHDGWKKSKRGNWYKTICRKAVSCRTALSPQHVPVPDMDIDIAPDVFGGGKK